MNKRKILCTSALPYSNGEIHLGHLFEHIMTDIFVKYQKQIGNECFYICADDNHGTAVMINAKKQNKKPEELIEKIKEEHLNDFKKFSIDYDNYHQTHSLENEKYLKYFFYGIKKYLIEKEVEQLYDLENNMFLSDRFVKGTCPKCKSEDQYGDNCDNCGVVYSAIDLINPYSTINGNKNIIIKKTKHLFFNINDKRIMNELEKWIESQNILDFPLKNKIKDMLNEGKIDGNNLKCITRDEPYFGFKITNDKYAYVWLDAPIGYIASLSNLNDNLVETFFKKENNEKTEIIQIIGKDIAYFHYVLWNSLLIANNMKLPNKIISHGFVNVDNKKMSKSKGNFITAKDYIEKFKNDEFASDYLRYYFASKINGSHENDINYSEEELINLINVDLLNNFINIFSRIIKFKSKETVFNIKKIMNEKTKVNKNIFENFEKFNYKKNIEFVRKENFELNRIIENNRIWEMEDNIERKKIVETVVNKIIENSYILKPIIPKITEKLLSEIEKSNNENYKYKHIMKRL